MRGNSQALSSCNAWMSGPRPAEDDVVLAIKEVRYCALAKVRLEVDRVCLPVYAGYNSIGSKPSCLSNTELVHSQRPPIPAWPASLSPFCATGIGCQCLKPTLIPWRSMWRSSGLGAAAVSDERVREGWDGGDSCTPLLIKWLYQHQQVKVFKTPIYSPIDGWNRLS